MTVVDFTRGRGRGAGGWRGVVLAVLGAALWGAVEARDHGRAPVQAASSDTPTARRQRLLAEADTLVASMDAAPTPQRLEALASALAALRIADVGAPMPAALASDLDRAAAALRDIAARPGADPLGRQREARVDQPSLRELLARARRALDGTVALGLAFQGSYSQSKVKEQVYGGHASAMGPAPAPATTAAPPLQSPVTFVERGPLPTRTFDGGPTKDHIIESPGNGVALVDVDDDGLLDIYLVTGAELTATRERVAHRNALYRNRGNWQFEDISARAGVDAAAWGNGVCAGDVDGDGRVDLYVTNWGTCTSPTACSRASARLDEMCRRPTSANQNFLYRNTGRGERLRGHQRRCRAAHAAADDALHLLVSLRSLRDLG